MLNTVKTKCSSGAGCSWFSHQQNDMERPYSSIDLCQISHRIWIKSVNMLWCSYISDTLVSFAPIIYCMLHSVIFTYFLYMQETEPVTEQQPKVNTSHAFKHGSVLRLWSAGLHIMKHFSKWKALLCVIIKRCRNQCKRIFTKTGCKCELQCI